MGSGYGFKREFAVNESNTPQSSPMFKLWGSGSITQQQRNVKWKNFDPQ